MELMFTTIGVKNIPPKNYAMSLTTHEWSELKNLDLAQNSSANTV